MKKKQQKKPQKKKPTNENKIVFIHIPKTGGGSVQQALRQAGFLGGKASHSTYMSYKKRPKIVAVTLRNPYDRFLSMYYWTMKKPKLYKSKIDINSITFEKFVLEDEYKNIINSYQYYWKPLTHWITDNTQVDGNINIDHLLRFENLQNDFDEMCEKYKIKTKLPHLNENQKFPSNKRPSSDKLLTDDVKAKICEVWGTDFEIFNYEK